jgi:hypothetical protein
MKQFFGAAALLLAFSVLALSFCVIRFSVTHAEGADAVSVSYREDEAGKMGKLHIRFSDALAEAATDVFLAVRDAARALPFFAVDLAENFLKEAREVFRLLGSVTEKGDTEGAFWI